MTHGRLRDDATGLPEDALAPLDESSARSRTRGEACDNDVQAAMCRQRCAGSGGDGVKVTVLGVPNSAGAYCVGVERAPAALREAGLLEALAGGERDASVGGERDAAEGGGPVVVNDVIDAGDLTTRLWAPDPGNRYAQNLDDEVEAMRELAEVAAGLLSQGEQEGKQQGEQEGEQQGERQGERLLVLGGSCTVALGMCAAVVQRGERPRVIYIDRHLDLNTPRSTTEGSFSWMGMAHALGLQGAAPQLAGATGQSPLLQPSDLVYLGVELTEVTAWERSRVRDLGITVVLQAELVGNPGRAARSAMAALTPGPFFVHVDVDVLDFINAPLAENVNGRNSGPTLAELGVALAELMQNADCRGMSLGQLVPAHARADPTAIPRIVQVLATAFTGARLTVE
jgi:arginase